MSPKDMAKSAAAYATQLSDFIYRWPWIGTAMGVAIFLAFESVLFYQGSLIWMELETLPELEKAMDRQFTFINWVFGTVLAALVGKRASTKATVVHAMADAEIKKSQAGVTGEFPAGGGA